LGRSVTAILLKKLSWPLIFNPIDTFKPYPGAATIQYIMRQGRGIEPEKAIPDDEIGIHTTVIYGSTFVHGGISLHNAVNELKFPQVHDPGTNRILTGGQVSLSKLNRHSIQQTFLAGTSCNKYMIHIIQAVIRIPYVTTKLDEVSHISPFFSRSFDSQEAAEDLDAVF
jgi:hypothetical protein